MVKSEPLFLLTGQVQSRECIEDVIRFAAKEHLFIMADEVTRYLSKGRFEECVFLRLNILTLFNSTSFRCIRITCTPRAVPSTLLRRCYLRWALNSPTQWSWPRSIPPPSVTWESEYTLSARLGLFPRLLMNTGIGM